MIATSTPYPRRTSKALFAIAATSYAANCALGTAVATKVLDTSGWRWIHHAVYICTVLSCSAAAVAGLAQNRGAGVALLPAAVPFAIIPRVSARTRGHIALALSAAPFVVTGTVRAWR